MDRFVPGFYTTKAAGDAVAGDWRLAGWTPRIVRITVDEGNVTKAAISAIVAAVGAPQEFGVRLETLGTALDSLNNPTVLIWVGGSAFADAHPRSWEPLSAALTKRTTAGSPFAVVLCGTESRRR